MKPFEGDPTAVQDIITKIQPSFEGHNLGDIHLACLAVAVLVQKFDLAPDLLPKVVYKASELISKELADIDFFSEDPNLTMNDNETIN